MIKYFLLLSFFVLNIQYIYGQDSLLINNVLKQIHLQINQCKPDLIRSKKLPNRPQESIVVIPEIVKEDEAYFELNSHIFIVVTSTGKIIHSFFESHETNEWYSDAIELVDIKIDTAPYELKAKKRAFGITVKYVGMSRVNPYILETLSLYIKDKNELKRVLNKFDISKYYGEWNGECQGDIKQEKKILIMDQNKTNGFYNIIIKNKKTTTITSLNEDEECIDDENTQTISSTLIYEDEAYKEVHYLD